MPVLLALLALVASSDGFVSRCPSSRVRASTSSSRAAFIGLELPELHAPALPSFEVPVLELPLASFESIGPVPVLAAAAGVSIALLGAALSSPAGASPSPYASGRYDPESARRYFGARPLLLYNSTRKARSLSLMAIFLPFLSTKSGLGTPVIAHSFSALLRASARSLGTANRWFPFCSGARSER